MKDETMNKFFESLENPTDSAIYDKCMKLAKQANIADSKAGIRGKCHNAAYWVEMLEKYCKREISEEQIKALFYQ